MSDERAETEYPGQIGAAFSQDLQRCIFAAEAALDRTIGHKHSVSVTERLDKGKRSIILRAVATGRSGRRTPIIIKAVRAPDHHAPPAFTRIPIGFAREWAAIGHLHRAGGNHAPAMLAGDREGGLLVLEDLGSEHLSLAAPLTGSDAAQAEHALTQSAATFGRMHADTACAIREYINFFQQEFPAMPPPAMLGYSWIDTGRKRMIQYTGDDSVPSGELDFVRERIRCPGPWLALTHGDGCPDNIMLVGNTARLIDFEAARPGHSLLDLVSRRLAFPSCWCAGRTPAEISTRTETVYRNELARTVPQALDDRMFATEFATVSVAWLMRSVGRRLTDCLDRDRQWGLCGTRSRLLWHLEATIDLTGRADILPGFRRTATKWLQDLRTRWHRSSPVPLYPAFTR